MIGSYFDAKSDAILQEHNAVEDAAIAIAKETLAAHQSQLGMLDDIQAIKGAHEETVKLLCQVESHKLRHEMRDLFVKNLESVSKYETRYASVMQSEMVEYATEEVRSVVEDGDESIKDDAFKAALSVLSQKSDGDEQEDAMVKLFCTHLRKYAESLEAESGSKVQLSSAEVTELQKELDALVKRHDLDAIEVKAPNEITLELLK